MPEQPKNYWANDSLIAIRATTGANSTLNVVIEQLF